MPPLELMLQDKQFFDKLYGDMLTASSDLWEQIDFVEGSAQPLCGV